MLILLLIICLVVGHQILYTTQTTFKRSGQLGGVFLVLVLCGQVQAQNPIDGLFTRDTTLARGGEDTNDQRGTPLIVEEAIIEELITNQPNELSLTIPYDETGDLTLILERKNFFTKNFKSNKNQLDSAGQVKHLHYSGSVLDQPGSIVALSLTKKKVTGLIRLPSKKTIAIRRVSNNSTRKHHAYNYNEQIAVGGLDCSDTDTMPAYQSKTLSRNSAIGDPVCISIRVEVDQDFKGDATGLLNQVVSIYETIGVDLKVSEIYYWDKPSPYTGTTKEIINQLQLALKSRAAVSGDLTLFLGGKGNGGRASSIGAICDVTAVCYSGQNDDVYTVTHELAHLFAAHHTHACKWNGNNTAIDGCGYNAGYGGCPAEDPPTGGTFLSYCHIRSVGINFEFHPQVASVIYNFIKDNNACTCQENIEEEIEEEYEEETPTGGTSENIIANICEMSIINPNNCTVDIHALTNSVKSELITTIASASSVSTPIKKGETYGIYVNGVLIDQFTSECGAVFSVNSCGTEGTVVTGKILLEGFYDSYSGSMHQNLLKQNLLSKTNPYSKAPWNYKGITTVNSLPANAVDWILIMSRNPEGKVYNQSVGFIATDGELMDVFGKPGIPLVGAEGQHVSFHHRGHMAVMTATAYKTGNNIDLTNSLTTVIGNSQLKSIGTIYALHAGDFDANGVINNMDYNHWVSNSSKINLYIPSDGDGNGVINNKDYNLWISNRSKIGHMPLHY